MMKHLILFPTMILAALAPEAMAATWYVDGSATGANNGASPTNAWRSFAAISWSSLSGGDVIRVADGNYLERVTVGASGLDTSERITFVGINHPTIHGIKADNRDYLAWIGFEIYQGADGYYEAVSLNGCDGWLLQDLDIHEIDGGGIVHKYGSSNNDNIVRGCTFQDLGTLQGNTTLGTGVRIYGDHNVVEYNRFGRGGDRTAVFGTENILRNNYMGPMRENDIPGTDPHIDDLQSYDSSSEFTRTLFEANFGEENDSGNAHWIIIRDVPDAGLNWLVARFNVSVKNGSVIGLFENFEDAWVYNNTFVDAQYRNTFDGDGVSDTLWEGKNYYAVNIYGNSYRHTWINNSFTRVAKNGNSPPVDIVYVRDGAVSTSVVEHNHEYQSGSLPGLGNVIGISPLFTDVDNLDFAPSSASPLRGSSRYLTRSTNVGTSATLLQVEDAGFFSDGWGIVEGDIISVGDGNWVQISEINPSTNTITLDEPRTWVENDNITILGAKDIGAYQFRNDGYVISGNISIIENRYTVAANDPLLVRMVVFYEDGIPQTPVFAEPFEYASAGGVVKANLYSRFASRTPVIAATPSFIDRPLAPKNLDAVDPSAP